MTDTDLDAYVDDQLDVTRRIEVEAFLSPRPEAAARVMSDLRTRDELRWRLPVPRAWRGRRPLTRRGGWRGGLSAAVSSVFCSAPRPSPPSLPPAGWLTAIIGADVGDQGHRFAAAARLFDEDAGTTTDTGARNHALAAGSAQLQCRRDPRRDRDHHAIAPKDWKVRDVQIYPSRFGPSVEMAVDTKDMGLVSLFAIRPGTFDVVKPTVAPSGDIPSAYFQIGEVAYAVVAKSGVHDLDRAAEALAKTLY